MKELRRIRYELTEDELNELSRDLVKIEHQRINHERDIKTAKECIKQNDEEIRDLTLKITGGYEYRELDLRIIFDWGEDVRYLINEMTDDIVLVEKIRPVDRERTGLFDAEDPSFNPDDGYLKALRERASGMKVDDHVEQVDLFTDQDGDEQAQADAGQTEGDFEGVTDVATDDRASDGENDDGLSDQMDREMDDDQPEEKPEPPTKKTGRKKTGVK